MLMDLHGDEDGEKIFSKPENVDEEYFILWGKEW
jgi:hypothetical protein